MTFKPGTFRENRTSLTTRPFIRFRLFQTIAQRNNIVFGLSVFFVCIVLYAIHVEFLYKFYLEFVPNTLTYYVIK